MRLGSIICLETREWAVGNHFLNHKMRVFLSQNFFLCFSGSSNNSHGRARNNRRTQDRRIPGRKVCKIKRPLQASPCKITSVCLCGCYCLVPSPYYCRSEKAWEWKCPLLRRAVSRQGRASKPSHLFFFLPRHVPNYRVMALGSGTATAVSVFPATGDGINSFPLGIKGR